MCQHDDFDVLFFNGEIIITKCKFCKQVEVMCIGPYAFRINELKAYVKKAEELEKEHA